MKNRIFVHIGLPKTATTSLQADFYTSLAGSEIEYAGVFQPRDSDQTDIYLAFRTAIYHKKDVAELRDMLSNFIKTKTLVLSDELITVWDKQISWRVKLANLKTILEGFDYGIIVTVRDPTAAMFSYYCEIYPRLGAGRRSFLDCALNHEAMQIFHYGKLISELSEHFASDRIHFFKFEDIVAGRIRELAALLTSGAQIDRAYSLKNHNRRSKSHGRVLTRHYFTAADFLCDFFSVFECCEKKGGSKILSRLLKWGRRLPIRPILIDPPKPDVILSLRKSLRKENQVIAQQYGLKY